MRYLLEGLHEDVNRVTVKPQSIHTEIDSNLRFFTLLSLLLLSNFIIIIITIILIIVIIIIFIIIYITIVIFFIINTIIIIFFLVFIILLKLSSFNFYIYIYKDAISVCLFNCLSVCLLTDHNSGT